jgi:hypothetical protein
MQRLLIAAGLVLFCATGAGADESPAPAASAQSAAAALAKYKSWIGWTLGEDGVTSVVINGTAPASAKTEQRVNIVVQRTLDAGSIAFFNGNARVYELGFDKCGNWVKRGASETEQVAKLEGTPPEVTASEIALFTNSFANFPAQEMGTLGSAGDVDDVLVQSPFGAPIRVAIARDTGQLMISAVKGSKQVLYARGLLRFAPPRNLTSTWRIGAGPATIEFTKVTLNGPTSIVPRTCSKK